MALGRKGPERKYSPENFCGTEVTTVTADPEAKHISTELRRTPEPLATRPCRVKSSASHAAARVGAPNKLCLQSVC